MFAKIFSKITGERMVTPSVTVNQIDSSVCDPSAHVAFPICPRGPVDSPTWIGPCYSMQPVRWWQFWRWYSIRAWRRERARANQEAIKKFKACFGNASLRDKTDDLIAIAYIMANPTIDVARDKDSRADNS